MLGWILVGAIAGLGTALIIAYWNRITDWLNNVVSDKIERVFGYGARKRFHHAVSLADRVVGGIRNRMFVYVKKQNEQGYDKYMEKECRVISEVEADIVKEIDEKETLIKEFEYRQE